FRLHKWPEERKQEAERIQSRAQVDETTNATLINLRPYLNAKLTDAPSGWPGDNADNLSEVPAGRHIFPRVPFDVEGSVQLMGGWMRHYRKTYPTKINIRIEQKCSRFHLLQGNSYLVVTNFGNVVARLVLHYTDGSSRDLDLIAGKQCFDWWAP